MRLLIAIGLVVLLVVLLHYAFPYALGDKDTRMRALYLVLLLALIVGGRRAFSRPMPKMARDGALWLGIFAVLVTAYAFRDELNRSRFMAELVPSRAQLNGDGTMSIRASEGGHFYVEGKVQGAAVRFLIDTGASDIVLSPDDARRAGFNPDTLDYSRFYTTAGGGVTGAPVTLKSLEVGNIILHDVSASVNKAWMPDSLLGMSFLRRLKGFRVEGDTLILIP